MEIRTGYKSRKNIIILSIVAFLFAVSGIFLLWRVNQKAELSPEDSSAAVCTTNGGATLLPGCLRCQCEDGTWVVGSSDKCYSLCGSLGHNKPAPTSGGGCTQGSQCPACEWPNVAYCGCPNDTNPASRKCGCRSPSNFSCGPACGQISDCTPPSCPSGWINCGVSGDSGAKSSGCVAKTSCDGKCLGCQNKFSVKRYCKKPSSNVCDSGEWETKPSGTYEYCEEIKYAFVAKDSDGIDSASISVKLNDNTRTGFNKVEETKQTKVSETLSSASNCLAAGTYNIATSWKDKKGAGGTNCALTATFQVLEEVLNPAWSISKQATEKCIDENTENPKAEISYVITVTNSGEGEGSMDKVIDQLDSKVSESYIGNISSGGVFSAGTLIWDLEGDDEKFIAGQNKSFSYTVTLSVSSFGQYKNVVVGYPKVGENITANATILADCDITTPEIPIEDLPETGIFDGVDTSLIWGTILLFLGLSWTWIGRRIYLFVDLLGSTQKKLVKGMKDSRRKRKKFTETRKNQMRKRKFEKKVVKKH